MIPDWQIEDTRMPDDYEPPDPMTEDEGFFHDEEVDSDLEDDPIYADDVPDTGGEG